jgi:hypothetical protein
MLAADMGHPPAAEWLRRTVVPTLRRLPDAAGWMAFRAGAMLIPERQGLAARLGAEVLGVASPLRVALFSPSGQPVSKVICFLFTDGEPAPRAIVKAMAEPRFSPRLRTEYERLESVRPRVAGDAAVAGALPAAAWLAREVAGEFMAVEPYDPLGAAPGGASAERVLHWLRAFQAASSARAQPWADADLRWAAEATRDAWRLAGRGSDDTVTARVLELLAPLRGAMLPRCAVHGDFWRGNVAADGAQLRVFDWEWCEPEGTPLTDLWTYELAELRIRARDGQARLDAPLAGALARVEAELRARGLDERLALATLAPVLGELAFRVRRRLAMPDEMERPSVAVMAAVERRLLQR